LTSQVDKQFSYPVAQSNTAGSFKYLGVEITTDLTDTAEIDAKLSRAWSWHIYIIVESIP